MSELLRSSYQSKMMDQAGGRRLGRERGRRLAQRLLKRAEDFGPGTSEEYVRQELVGSVLLSWFMIALFKVIIDRMIEIAIEYWKERNAA